jgi:hypothetical protein
MSSYKSGSYVRQNSIKKKDVTITVTRLTNAVAHESDNNIDPQDVEQDAWFERLFSEDGSDDTSDWSREESSSVEEDTSEHIPSEIDTPPITAKGRFVRLVSAGKCRLRIKKHTPEQITEPILFNRKQKRFPLELLAWLTWKRYKDLTEFRLGYIQEKVNHYLRDSPQLNAFIDSFCAYEYERLCRPYVLEFMHSLRQ